MPMAYPCCRSIELNFQSVGCCYFNCPCTTVPGFFPGDREIPMRTCSQEPIDLSRHCRCWRCSHCASRLATTERKASGRRPEQRCENHEAEHLTAHHLTRKYGRSASVKRPYLLHSVLRVTQE